MSIPRSQENETRDPPPPRRAHRPSVLSRIEPVAEMQFGYVTRAQAATLGVHDYELMRAVDAGALHRPDHGVYRVAGAGADLLGELRTSWFRLDPTRMPLERTTRPTLWISHQSAAEVLGLGTLLPARPEFTSARRLQSRTRARVRLRREGVDRDEWLVKEGLPVTTPARTLRDLTRAHTPTLQLARFIADALAAGMIAEAALLSVVSNTTLREIRSGV